MARNKFKLPFDFDENILLMTDSYKVSQPSQYPKNTKKMISYLESRGGIFPSTLVIGISYLIERYLVGQVVTMEKIEDAEKFWNAHFGRSVFPRAAWERIVNVHNGCLPVKIKAVPEGTVVGTRNVLLMIESLDEELPWLPNFLESLILNVWYPMTVGTQDREIKKIFFEWYKETTSYTDLEIIERIELMLQDFGMRGTSSPQSAAWGGFAHLVNFKGSDNAMAIRFTQRWYDTDEMVGFSIRASEHSTITSWGKENEIDAYKNMLEEFPDGMFACVSDSYDILHAVKNLWTGKELLPIVLNRNGKLVIRLDSGSATATIRIIFDVLWEKVGGHINEKGFRVLNEKISLLQGDGVNYHSIIAIKNMMVAEKISPENLALGMGGALLQKVNRDDQNFAFKCCALYKEVNNELVFVEVLKSPIEFDDAGNRVVSFKKSKSGDLKLVESLDFKNEQDRFYTLTSHDPNFKEAQDILIEYFNTGESLYEPTIHEIRKAAQLPISNEIEA